MFFKKRVPVADYCDTKLKALTAEETLRSWVDLKGKSEDRAFHTVSDKSLADQLLAAHIQLLSLAITKQYRDIELAAEAYMCIKSFIEQSGKSHLSDLKDQYNRAFGNSPTDGVSEMVRLLDMNLTNGHLASQTKEMVYDLMYKSLSSYFADFKSQKLVKS